MILLWLAHRMESASWNTILINVVTFYYTYIKLQFHVYVAVLKKLRHFVWPFKYIDICEMLNN